MTHLTAGDRIEVTVPIDEFTPLPVGERGTVIHTANAGTQFEQVHVEWDSGRTLMLIPDDYASVRIVSEKPSRLPDDGPLVRDGHARLQAAKKLGITVVAVEEVGGELGTGLHQAVEGRAERAARGHTDVLRMMNPQQLRNSRHLSQASVRWHEGAGAGAEDAAHLAAVQKRCIERIDAELARRGLTP